ncbi:MAG: hypothetical protein KIS96_10250 [Bauldia sp.]|nr:hypothetical protein [Bauldia sp.]
MAQKPKAGGAKKPAPKKAAKKAPKDEKPQRERFIEAAGAAGVTKDEFDTLFASVVTPKKRS